MSPSQIEANLASHAAEIQALKETQQQQHLDHHYLQREFDRLRMWIMATLAAALIGLAVQVLRLMTK